MRVIEMAGIGPTPFCGMLLADMGAEVIRVDRLEPSGLGIAFPPRFDLLNRSKRSLAIDLKKPVGVAALTRMIADADILIEGFRPGVMEKLGLGPELLLERNPRLVYGRMTGWGQDGPLAKAAGHDLNYIAITGALAAIGEAGGPPVIPLNLIGDFSGGSLYLAMGILAALLSARATGRGQVVDAAIVDGVASLMTLQHALHAMGTISLERGTNLLDGGSPFYAVYATADKRWISVAAVEPKFYAELLHRIGLADAGLPEQYDQTGWPQLRQAFGRRFLERSRDEWCALLEGSDTCFAPVLDLEEAVAYSHNVFRSTHMSADGIVSPAPAPRFTDSPAKPRKSASATGADTAAVLTDWGFGAAEQAFLAEAGIIRTTEII